MKYRKLGRTDIDVSLICLGTMTFGEQNSQEEAFAQMDYAIEQGVNFFDTAELYAIPPKAQTYGATEEIIGRWMKARGSRGKIVLASKVAGPTSWVPHIRDGAAILDRSNIRIAVEGSLRRLGTDHIDLYQVHWPERPTNYFGRLGYLPAEDETPSTPIDETLDALTELVREGKVGHIGISNESPWGTMRYLAAAERLGLERIVSIQNPYSLLNRSFEVAGAEIAHREGVGLLAYSPLAFGVLSGKYLGGEMPAGARITLFPDYTRYSNEQGVTATSAYVTLAREHGLDPAQMALAYVNSRPFVTANIIGATTVEQLEGNIASVDLELTEEVLEAIEAIHSRYTYPCP
ncbi:NADP(H)-dependent aldo-keto reductase [Endothiovibrio diazotrophicus]